MGHHSAVLVGHADGGLVCWATAMLHPRVVRGIALVSSPHPVALRSSTLTDKGQRAALLPAMLRNQVPWWPEHVLTRRGGAAVEQLVRSRAGA
ncbi:alpha/beta fold hydrolase, partial [Acinetobacter baumannii]